MIYELSLWQMFSLFLLFLFIFFVFCIEIYISKQSRPWSDAMICAIWTGFALFVPKAGFRSWNFDIHLTQLLCQHKPELSWHRLGHQLWADSQISNQRREHSWCFSDQPTITHREIQSCPRNKCPWHCLCGGKYMGCQYQTTTTYDLPMEECGHRKSKASCSRFLHKTHNTTDTNINTLWHTLKEYTASLLEDKVPSKMTSSRFSQPWINRKIKRISRRKKRAFGKAKAILLRQWYPTIQETPKGIPVRV